METLGNEFYRTVKLQTEVSFNLSEITPELIETIKKHLEKRKWTY